MNGRLKVFSSVVLAIVMMCSTACNLTKKSSNDSQIISSQTNYSSLDDSSSESSNNTAQYKYSFTDIGKLLANISGANAFGIKSPSKKKQQSVAVKNAANDEIVQTQNLWVKSSTIYDSSEPSVNDDGTINVTFLQTVTTTTADEVTVTKDIRLDSSNYELEVLARLSDGVIVKSEEGREFRVVSGEEILLDWTKGELASTLVDVEIDSELQEGTYLSFSTSQEYEIETRLIGNLSYRFNALEGDKYSLKEKDAEASLYVDVVDNDQNDKDPTVGMIELSGLTGGVDYSFTQVGIRYNVTVEQSEIDGVVDKLYTTPRYTFISFIPRGATGRPAADKLKYTYFGLTTYDEENYYSDKTRQSFVIDNDTGLVYKIENFKIAKIAYNLIFSADDSYVYDMKIDDQKQLVFYTLVSNPSVTIYEVHKDKYGHCFIWNDKIDDYDAEKDVRYFKYHDYYLTSNKETFRITYANNGDPNGAFLVKEDGSERAITSQDSFDVMYWPAHFYSNTPTLVPFKVVDGCVELIQHWNTIDSNAFQSSYQLGCYCVAQNNFYAYSIDRWFNKADVNLRFLNEHDIMILHKSNNVYALKNFFKSVRQKSLNNEGIGDTSYNPFVEIFDLNNESYSDYEIILSNVDVVSGRYAQKTGAAETVNYDFKLVEKDGQKSVEAFVQGTIGEETKTIVLQPIN